MQDRTYNGLFICTGNSARSILAEAIIDHWSKGRFKGYSAASFPKGEVNPLALNLLNRLGMPTAHLRSKSWAEFTEPGAPVMDFVFTVCDQKRADGRLLSHALAPFPPSFRKACSACTIYITSAVRRALNSREPRLTSYSVPRRRGIG